MTARPPPPRLSHFTQRPITDGGFEFYRPREDIRDASLLLGTSTGTNSGPWDFDSDSENDDDDDQKGHGGDPHAGPDAGVGGPTVQNTTVFSFPRLAVEFVIMRPRPESCKGGHSPTEFQVWSLSRARCTLKLYDQHLFHWERPQQHF